MQYLLDHFSKNRRIWIFINTGFNLLVQVIFGAIYKSTCNYIQRSKNVILHVYYRFPSANDTNKERFCCMALKVILTLLQILKYSQETFLFGKSISGKPRIPEKWTEFCLHYSTERGIFNKPYILVTTSLLWYAVV